MSWYWTLLKLSPTGGSRQIFVGVRFFFFWIGRVRCKSLEISIYMRQFESKVEVESKAVKALALMNRVLDIYSTCTSVVNVSGNT